MYTVMFGLFSSFYFISRELCIFLSKIVSFIIGLILALLGVFIYSLILLLPLLVFIEPGFELIDKISVIGAVFLYAGFLHKFSIEKSLYFFMGSFLFWYIARSFGSDVLMVAGGTLFIVSLLTLAYNLFIKEDIQQAFKLLE